MAQVSRSPTDADSTTAARLVAQIADHAIIALDPSGAITSWNAGAVRLTGYSESDALGRHFSIFHPTGNPEAALLSQARDQGSLHHVGWCLRAPTAPVSGGTQ